MSNEPFATHKPIPRHIVAGIVCSFLALLLITFAVAYYLLVGAGILSEPPRGLSPLWAMVIVLPAMVPISLWAANCAVRPVRQEVSALRGELRSALDRFGGEAMEAARNAGKWEGFATGIRDTSDTGEVRQLHPRRSG